MSFWALRGWCSFTDREAGPFASTVVGPGSVFRIVLPVLSAAATPPSGYAVITGTNGNEV
jgi:hypothetical protein